MANAEGGDLIIGLETQRSPERDADIVSGLKLIGKEAVSASQCSDVLTEYIYPRLRGARVRFVPNADGGLGVIVISIPPQHADSRPYLILRVVEDGAELKQIVVGYVQRQGGQNTPISASSLHQYFRKGSDSIAVRLGRIEEKLEAALDQRTALAPNAAPDTQQLNRRIKEILEGLD